MRDSFGLAEKNILKHKRKQIKKQKFMTNNCQGGLYYDKYNEKNA